MNHIPEWKKIRDNYKTILDNDFTKYLPKEAIKFRIERINHLISQEEQKEKELNHFR